MVTWQEFVRITQDVYSEKSGSSGFDSKRGELMKDVGDYWQENKETVQGWTEAEARQWARSAVMV